MWVNSRLRMRNKEESETEDRDKERKERAGGRPDGGGETGRETQKVVALLRWRRTKQVAARRERERERIRADAAPEQNKCIALLLNIGHTSPVTVPFPPLNLLPTVRLVQKSYFESLFL